jgi:hypothetical protein
MLDLENVHAACCHAKKPNAILLTVREAGSAASAAAASHQRCRLSWLAFSFRASAAVCKDGSSDGLQNGNFGAL